MPLVPLSASDTLDGPDVTAQPRTLVQLGANEPLDTEEYTGSILPMRRDAQGGLHLAVPGLISGLFDTAASAVAAPGDAYMGRLPTPYTQVRVPSNDPESVGIAALRNVGVPATGGIAPDAINRAIDFASIFGGQPGVASRAGELMPGEIAAATPVPSAQALKQAAGAGYDAARASPLTVPGSDIADMAQQLQGQLASEHGVIPKTAPKTYAILDELANPPFGAEGNYSGLEAARRGLSSIAGEGGTEGYAAQRAIPQLDQFIDSISPTAADARANYAAAMRSNDLTGTLDRANTGILERATTRAEATHSGTNIDNAIRQRVASLLEKPSEVGGFSDPEIAALQNVVAGTFPQNAARRVGNVLGGGGGLGQLAALGGGALLGGHVIGGVEGPALGAMLAPAIGTSAKGLENVLARRSLNNVDELVRQRSPLYDAMSSQMPSPSLSGNLLTSTPTLATLLGSQQQQPTNQNMTYTLAKILGLVQPQPPNASGVR